MQIIGKFLIALGVVTAFALGAWWFWSLRVVCGDCGDASSLSMQEPETVSAPVAGTYVGSLYKDNYVWGGAMNLAWNELSDEIIGEAIQIASSDEATQNIVQAFNARPFTVEDLDSESYYVQAGYGQETVDRINTESREKFPSKSFGDLSMQLDDRDIIAYAYFLKEVQYHEVFDQTDLWVNNERVNAFEATTAAQRQGVEVLDYRSDEQFMIRLRLKDQSDELILAKGYDMSSPDEVLSALHAVETKELLPGLTEDEPFIAPTLSLSMRRDYAELSGQFLANAGFEDYEIDQMFENIAFDMDEAGARVENEGVIVTQETAAFIPEPFRQFILDQPYWVIMKRADSHNPYFLLGVNNTALMEVVE